MSLFAVHPVETKMKHSRFVCHRLQTKFSKVMFSQASVILPGGGEGVLHRGVLHPGEFCIQGGSASGGVYIWGGVCMGGGAAGGGQTSPPLDTTGYGQRVGSMHPTGMHSCLSNI